MTDPSGRDGAAEAWLREAIGQIGVELGRFARTFAAFAIRPRQAAAAWQAGEPYMNPLGFAAWAAGAYWASVSLIAALWVIPGPNDGNTVADQLASTIGPYLHYGLLGLAMHLMLRMLGSPRRVTGSIGVAFFAGGSVGSFNAVILTIVTSWIAHVRGTRVLELKDGDLVPLGVLVASALSYCAVCLVMAGALTGLHRAPAWKAVLAALFAIVVTAFLFGTVLPDGAYGWRPYIGVDLPGGFSFGFKG